MKSALTSFILLFACVSIAHAQESKNKFKKKFFHKTLTVYTGIKPQISEECQQLIAKQFGVVFMWTQESYDKKEDSKNRKKMAGRFGDNWANIVRDETASCMNNSK